MNDFDKSNEDAIMKNEFKKLTKDINTYEICDCCGSLVLFWELVHHRELGNICENCYEKKKAKILG